MRIVLDLEANKLRNPTEIWVIVCKDIDTGKTYIFRNLTGDNNEKNKFLSFSSGITCWIGHNITEYDLPVLCNLLHLCYPSMDMVRDTLVLSRLIDYPREHHSIEDYGTEFNFPKLVFSDFSHYSLEMEEYCMRDVDICEMIWKKYQKYISNPKHQEAILLEHEFQHVVNALHDNGFAFDIPKAEKLLVKVEGMLEILDKEILEEFKPKEVLVREFIPRPTKFGTIALNSVPRSWRERIPELEIGRSYELTKTVPFNPSSPKQIVSVLNEANWKPEDKTKTHISVEREINRLKRLKHRSEDLDLSLKVLYDKYNGLQKYGYKINEHNLNTLPSTAPKPARTLAKRILIESRRRTLKEWLGLVSPDDSRIHGKYLGIGAWSHRMAHQAPNTANIPNTTKTDGSPVLFGKEMRALWRAPKNRLLVGCDAEGIQLRVFAHYIDDPEFTKALVEGKKEDKSDPHSLNARIIGEVCKSRAAAKRFIYALLLGAGMGKLSEILECQRADAEKALERILNRYQGFALLKSTIIPADARRGYFTGLDGRSVRIPGDSQSKRSHLCMSGYLQNGEAVIMKKATLKWEPILAEYDAMLVNLVHDEWQIETPNDLSIALTIAKMMADSLEEVGKELNLKCPLAGSYYNDDIKDYTIGLNWSVTH